ncbi:YesL family protein [Virgibacillus halodenitrificans]|uniref:YesL family protein n=1 Tax=Virgibacillus halodenitrificans TaxID=1482 RepID=UPI0024BFE800|nr:YesL family protein [Virgibacillus halodenitrificans]WHX26132.1 YesL family protein [Virgibacillus halodenitrificans]
MDRLAMGFYHISEWIVRIAYINFLWIGFTVAGLGVFGIMPATVAMFAVIRKWRNETNDISVFPIFWKIYKKEFFKANGFGIVFFGIGYLLTMEYQILRSMEQVSYFIASFAVLGLFLILAITLIYFFPVFVHFNLKNMQYMKWPFIIGIIHPILTVFLMVGVAFLNYAAFMFIPGVLFFFGGSVSAYIIWWGVSLTFSKYEQAI